jgi:hypothetical protein
MNKIVTSIQLFSLICLLTAMVAVDPVRSQPLGAAGELGPDALDLRVGIVPLDPATSIHNAGVAGRASPIADAGYFVIQLDGPLTPQRQALLNQAGIRLGSYLPANAWIIRLPAGFNPGASLSPLPFVRWLGTFDRAWKIAPEIGKRAWQTPERQALAQEQRVRLAVSLFAGRGSGGDCGAAWRHARRQADGYRAKRRVRHDRGRDASV